MTTLFVDSNNVCYRGWWALRNLTTEKGEHTGMELGFFQILLRLARTYSTMKIALVWDGVPVQRVTLYQKYKEKVFASHREKEEHESFVRRMHVLRRVCSNICDTYYDQHLEADELVARVVNNLREKVHKGSLHHAALFTSDEDWFGLVDSPSCFLIKPEKKGDQI